MERFIGLAGADALANSGDIGVGRCSRSAIRRNQKRNGLRRGFISNVDHAASPGTGREETPHPDCRRRGTPGAEFGAQLLFFYWLKSRKRPRVAGSASLVITR